MRRGGILVIRGRSEKLNAHRERLKSTRSMKYRSSAKVIVVDRDKSKEQLC
jgi:predicted phosphoribosyltransferase